MAENTTMETPYNPLTPWVKVLEYGGATGAENQVNYTPVWDGTDPTKHHPPVFRLSTRYQEILDTEATPALMSEMFLPDNLLERFVVHTNEYAKQRLPPSRVQDVTRPELLRFFAIYYYMGLVKLPNKKDYWKGGSDEVWPTHFPCMKLKRDRFEYIWRNLHLVKPDAVPVVDQEDEDENEDEDPEETHLEDIADSAEPQDNEDGLEEEDVGENSGNVAWYNKAAPLISHVNDISKRVCQRPGSKLSIDEMMRRFKGRSSATIRIKNKPIKEGYKFFALCDASTGFVYDFIPSARFENNTIHDTVVLLTACLPDRNTHNYVVAMDNYYTWARVVTTLTDMGLGVVGTARNARTWPPPEMKAIEDERFNTLYLLNDKGGFRIGRWIDNNRVLMVTNVHQGTEIVERKRRRPRQTNVNRRHLDQVWGADPVKSIHIPCIIDDYNHWMLGVDKADQFIAYYRPNLRCRRTWLPLMFHALDIARVNAYIACTQLGYEQARHASRQPVHKAFVAEYIKALLGRADTIEFRQTRRRWNEAVAPTTPSPKKARTSTTTPTLPDHRLLGDRREHTLQQKAKSDMGKRPRHRRCRRNGRHDSRSGNNLEKHFRKHHKNQKHDRHRRDMSGTTARTLDPKGPKSIIPSSVLQKQGGSGDDAFSSRKRSLAQVLFVFPRKNGTKEPYRFDKSKSIVPAEKAENDIKTVEQAPRSSRSIDEILSASGTRQGANYISDVRRADESKKVPSDRNSQTYSDGHLSGRSVEDAVKDRVGCRPRSNSTDGELNLPQRGLCDERMVLESFRWKLERFSLGGGKPKGFSNLGNTCYLNSTLQCLAYIPPFAQSLLSLSSKRGKSVSPGTMVTVMIKNLFSRVHHSNDSTSSSIAPRKLVNAVPTLNKIGSRGGYRFRPGRQEDSHEFLVHLLGAMNDGELREAGINQHTNGWRDRLPIPRLDETTFIYRTFGGYLRSQVRCTRCDYKSNTYDPFLDLSLEVSKKSCNSIMDALRDFTRKEKLDNENRWKCSGCKERVCATKQLTVFRPPLVLCLQLKRFAFTGGFAPFGFGGFGGGKKISKPIEFPSVLKLPLSDGRSCQYALTGIVVHLGGSATSGHYTACVKTPPTRDGKSGWFHMDDSYVEPISESTVLRQKDAYVLFYCRTEVNIEYPTPPLRGSMSAEEAKAFGRARSFIRGKTSDGTPRPMKTSTKTNEAHNPEDSLIVNAKPATPGKHHESEVDDNVRNQPKSDVSGVKATTDRLRHTNGYSDDRPMKSSSDREHTTNLTKSSGGFTAVKGPEQLINVHAHSSADNTTTSTPRKEAVRNSCTESSSSSNASDDAPKKHDRRAGNSEQVRVAPKEMPQTIEPGDATNMPRSRVSFGRGEGNGMVSVVLGTRGRGRAWSHDASRVTHNDRKYDLLGNVAITQWEEGDEEVGILPEQDHRAALMRSVTKEEKQRKKRSFLDGWDAALDRGKKKKVKNDMQTASFHSPTHRFQKIQTSVQKMNRGRAKGFFHRPSRGRRKNRS